MRGATSTVEGYHVQVDRDSSDDLLRAALRTGWSVHALTPEPTPEPPRIPASTSRELEVTSDPADTAASHTAAQADPTPIGTTPTDPTPAGGTPSDATPVGPTSLGDDPADGAERTVSTSSEEPTPTAGSTSTEPAEHDLSADAESEDEPAAAISRGGR